MSPDTPQDLRAVVLAELRNLTPEEDPATIPGDADIRDALDFDSVDILNLTIALAKRLSLDIPEKDVPALTTIDGAVDYLSRALAGHSTEGPRSGGGSSSGNSTGSG